MIELFYRENVKANYHPRRNELNVYQSYTRNINLSWGNLRAEADNKAAPTQVILV